VPFGAVFVLALIFLSDLPKVGQGVGTMQERKHSYLKRACEQKLNERLKKLVRAYGSCGTAYVGSKLSRAIETERK
jgi:hypothetical protein